MPVKREQATAVETILENADINQGLGCLGLFGQRISGFSTLPWPAAGNYSGLRSVADN